MTIPLAQIKELRDASGAGMMECKEVLEESGGELKLAMELLRKRGRAKMAKRQDRTAEEGWVGAYVHTNGKIAAMVALKCETDFVARNEAFQQLARELAMQVAAFNPPYIRPEDIPEDELNHERGVIEEQLRAEGKPEMMFEKILPGKLEKYYREVCLLKQVTVRDEKQTVEELLSEAVQKLGEKIEVTKIVYLTL
ncbi:MAG: elongation factor Ts [Patescibacteria group bacterium]